MRMVLTEQQKLQIIEKTRGISITRSLGLNIEALEDGFCEMTAPRRQDDEGPSGVFHGGLLMTVADSAAFVAIMTRAGLAARMATTDMNIRLLAPCFTGVRSEARVVHLGRTLGLVVVDLFDESEKRVAIAQVNYMLFNRSDKRNSPAEVVKRSDPLPTEPAAQFGTAAN